MKAPVGVLGCGWLGLPLATYLLEKGYPVHGSTTSDDKIRKLDNAGIRPFRVLLREDGIQGDIDGFLKGLDHLVINVPPGLRGNPAGNYIQKMRHLLTAILKSGTGHLIFVSSTSVYGRVLGEVTEAHPPRPVTASGRQLLAVEQMFRNMESLSTAIIRFGGLIGPNRHPVTRMSGKKGLEGGNEPVNLIHRDDCIHMIRTLLENDYWGQVFNGVHPTHPGKRDYYLSEALKRKLPPPEFRDPPGVIKGKYIISRNFLNYNYGFLTSI